MVFQGEIKDQQIAQTALKDVAAMSKSSQTVSFVSQKKTEEQFAHENTRKEENETRKPRKGLRMTQM